MRKRDVVVAAMTMGAMGVAACSLIAPLDDTQCTTDADCLARGAAFAGSVCVNHVCAAGSDIDSGADVVTVDASEAAADGPLDPWRCLADPPQKIDPTESVDLQVIALDALKSITTNGVNGGTDLQLLTGTPLSGVNVRACDTFDTTCSQPLYQSSGFVVTDDAGVAHFPVKGDFSGYFELTRDDPPALFPTIVFPGRVLTGQAVQTDLFPLLSIIGTKSLAGTLGVPLAVDPDGGLGHAFVLNYDCDDRHAAGVSYTFGDGGAPDGAVFFYQRNQFPDQNAKDTDSLGFGGVINYPAGFAIVTATEAATGRQLGNITMLIRPGQTTFNWIRVRVR